MRDERDLYARAALEQMARRAANFRCVPVLSEPSARWHGRRGWVHEAVLGDIEQLARYEVYASGPPAMIEAVRREFALRGVAADAACCSIPSTMRPIRSRASGRWPPPSPDLRPTFGLQQRRRQSALAQAVRDPRSLGTTQCARSNSARSAGVASREQIGGRSRRWSP